MQCAALKILWHICCFKLGQGNKMWLPLNCPNGHRRWRGRFYEGRRWICIWVTFPYFLWNTCFFNLFVMVIVSPLVDLCWFDNLSFTNGLRYNTNYGFSYEILHQRGVYFTISKTQNIHCGCTFDARYLAVYQINIVVQTIGISTQYTDTPVKLIL